MGPHSFERGNRSRSDTSPNARGSLQWGLTLSSEETGRNLLPTKPVTRLQWGLTLSSEETRRDLQDSRPHLNRFNGASLFRARKHVGEATRTFRQWGFNGASLFRARKLGTDPVPGTYTVVLQWGLTLSSEETSSLAHPSPASGVASMGPHSFERGNLGDRNEGVVGSRASMGPHSFERGNFDAVGNISRIEAASMGPHSFERGNTLIPVSVLPVSAASMGPHSFERGNS